LLLDTHALLWWLFGQQLLTPAAKSAITDDDNEIFVSAASAWEISTKRRIGKLPDADSLSDGLEEVVRTQGFLPLPVTLSHGEAGGALPGLHKDPFDRLLIAQATLEGLVFVSNERLFDSYGVRRLW
jgi:PIN domain nuclease of toxin-antitoxin system